MNRCAVCEGSPRVLGFLRELVRLASASLPTPTYCSITLTAEESVRPYTAAAGHRIVDQVDRRQYDEGEGPCLETLRTGVPHRVDDAGREERFGSFPGIAQLNLHASRPYGFEPSVREQAAVFAGHASGALGVALKFAGRLRTALEVAREVVSHRKRFERD